jgi:hypothetical protein
MTHRQTSVPSLLHQNPAVLIDSADDPWHSRRATTVTASSPAANELLKAM